MGTAGSRERPRPGLGRRRTPVEDREHARTMALHLGGADAVDRLHGVRRPRFEAHEREELAVREQDVRRHAFLPRASRTPLAKGIVERPVGRREFGDGGRGAPPRSPALGGRDRRLGRRRRRALVGHETREVGDVVHAEEVLADRDHLLVPHEIRQRAFVETAEARGIAKRQEADAHGGDS